MTPIGNEKKRMLFREKTIQILGKSAFPLSTRELANRLRFRRVRLPDYEVSRRLRTLADDGVLFYKKGRWSAEGHPFADTQKAVNHLSLPKLSDETLALIDQQTAQSKKPSPESGAALDEGEGIDITADTASGRWGMFRKLLGYYRECIRNEDGADASAFQNQHGQQFIYLQKSGPWFPRPGLEWHMSIPVSDHFSPMLKLLPSRGDSQSLVIGYPV